MFIIVLLPEPDGPTIATNSPGWMSRLTSSRAGTRDAAHGVDAADPVEGDERAAVMAVFVRPRSTLVAGPPLEPGALSADRRPRRRTAEPPLFWLAVPMRSDGRAGHDGGALGEAGLDLGRRARHEPDLDRGPLWRAVRGERHDGVVAGRALERRARNGQHAGRAGGRDGDVGAHAGPGLGRRVREGHRDGEGHDPDEPSAATGEMAETVPSTSVSSASIVTDAVWPTLMSARSLSTTSVVTW